MRTNFTNTVGMSIIVAALAACSVELTESETAQVNSKYRPLVNALIPACITTGLGQEADYTGLKRLGYRQRAPIFGSGDYLYSTKDNALFRPKTGINFIPGEGCTVNITPTDAKAFHEIGEIWHRALKEHGYADLGKSVSDYSFTADGVDFYFSGTKSLSSSAGTQTVYYQTQITYFLKRER